MQLWTITFVHFSLRHDNISYQRNGTRQHWCQLSLRQATLKPSPLCSATSPSSACFLETARDDSSSYRVQRFNTTPSCRLPAGSLCTSVSKCCSASFRRPRYSEHTARLFTAWYRHHSKLCVLLIWKTKYLFLHRPDKCCIHFDPRIPDYHTQYVWLWVSIIRHVLAATNYSTNSVVSILSRVQLITSRCVLWLQFSSQRWHVSANISLNRSLNRTGPTETGFCQFLST